MSEKNTRTNGKGKASKNPSTTPTEIKIIVELRFPQLETANTPSIAIKAPAPGLMHAGVTIMAKATAVFKITPVKAVHIVQIDVNETTIIQDKDLSADEEHSGTGQVSPSKPTTLFLHITGEANTQMSVELQLDGTKIYSSPLHIPNTGRLVIQPTIL